MQGHRSPGAIIRALLELPAAGHAVNLYTPQQPCCPDPALDNDGAAARLARLRQHLEATRASPLALIGEAAGWRGARQTGIAFTAPGNVRAGAMREASATVVQTELAGHGLVSPARLLNAYPLHPHPPGQPRMNRAPTALELTEAHPVLAAAVGERLVVAVGRNAARSWSTISGIGIRSRGPSSLFRRGERLPSRAHYGPRPLRPHR